MSIPKDATIAEIAARNKLIKVFRNRKITEIKDNVIEDSSIKRNTFEALNIIMIVNNLFQLGDILLILPQIIIISSVDTLAILL